MNAWIDRVRTLVLEAGSPVAVWADEDWGVHRVVASLRHPEQPLIWIDLGLVDCSDGVAVGDALSEAVRFGLGAPLFGTGAVWRMVWAFLHRIFLCSSRSLLC